MLYISSKYAYSGSGSTATNIGNTYYYTLAGRLLGTWDGSSPTTTFLLTDSLGSVVSSFNNPASGAVMQGNQLYGPYGNQRLKQGSLSTNKGFTGQYNDGLTGLDYYNARYYDPTIGLFLSADPMGGLDAYGYVGGNPESDTDPSGLYRVAAIGPSGGSSASMSAPVVSSGGAGSLPYPFHPWTPPPVPGPAGGLVSHYTPPLPAPAAAVFHVSPHNSVVNVRRPENGVTSCGVPLSQGTCGNFWTNYASYTPTGFAFSFTGNWCFACSSGGGNHSDAGSSSDSGILTSSDEAGVSGESTNGQDPLALEADARAKALFKPLETAWYVRVELTISVAYMEDDEGGTQELVSINESALRKWGNSVEASLGSDETWVEGDPGGSLHAEMVLYKYAEETGGTIVGIGASKKFCAVCGSFLLENLGQAKLGQLVNP